MLPWSTNVGRNVSSLEDFQEMKIGAREVVHPRRLAAEAAAGELDGGAVRGRA